MSLQDNTDTRRLEMEENGHRVYADYRREGNVLHIPHVEAAPALRGTGAAGRFMQELVAYARAHDLKIRPICGYAASWLQKHKESHDLLA